MKINGAMILIECLKEQGVEVVFGYPGGAVLNIYDALYHEKGIKHLLTAHEQGASHAADGYARVTGKVGVCLATSGPGATNLVTGIATAYMDSVPMVAITGNVATKLLGKDSFQEVDILGLTLPITKHNYIVKKVDQLADTIREAFYIAQSGRPGPVLVDIPKDVTVAMAEYEYKEPKQVIYEINEQEERAIEEAVKLINTSQKPFIYSGGGVIKSGADKELYALVEKIDAPIATSLMGLGAFPETHPYHTGLLGMHGSKASNMAATACDLFIAIGVRFSDRVTSSIETFAPHAKILHIDIDPAEIDKNVISYASIIGNAKCILTQLLERIEVNRHVAWIKQIDEWKQDAPCGDSKGEILGPQFIMETIDEQTKGEAIITTEVGQHQLWAAQYFKYTEPRTFISSGGLGTMGYGTGAAMGAQIGRRDRQVINIAGDGSFRMNCNELSTIGYYQIPVIIIVFNNSVLGMVRQWQNMFYEGRYSETILDRGPDFVKLAEAYGIKGYRATTQAEFKDILKEVLISKAPVVIDCLIGKDERVLPMVAPGAPIHELILE